MAWGQGCPQVEVELGDRVERDPGRAHRGTLTDISAPVWGVRSRSLRCDELVLVNESSEDVVTLKLLERHMGCHEDRAAIRCDEADPRRRSVLVVVTDVDGQDTLEMVAADDKGGGRGTRAERCLKRHGFDAVSF